jgi:hypothetical protein
MIFIAFCLPFCRMKPVLIRDTWLAICEILVLISNIQYSR